MKVEPAEDEPGLIVISDQPQDTITLGRIMGAQLGMGAVIALIGELGSGKTCITQGIAQGLGVPDAYYITSPTFTLINEYPGRIPLYHLDVYRLSGAEDLVDLGYEEYFYGNGVIVIEWAEKIQDILPAGCLYVYFTYIDENSRQMKITGNNEMLSSIMQSLRKGAVQ